MSELNEEERAAIGHWAVTITNRVNKQAKRIDELEQTLEDINHNVNAATYILKTFMDSLGHSKAGDT